MGLWGVHSFENDDAVEWAAAYREMGLSVAQSTIDIALSDHTNNSLTAELACRAIAAVEAVAFSLGRGSAAAEKAFEGGPATDVTLAVSLVEDCESMLAAITGGSPLKEHWREAGAGELAAWKAAVAELGTRVTGSGPLEQAEQAAPEDSPAAQPVATAAAAPAGSELDDIRMAIVELSEELHAMRKETAENFRILAKLIEGRDG